jgi:hypothetical protein
MNGTYYVHSFSYFPTKINAKRVKSSKKTSKSQKSDKKKPVYKVTMLTYLNRIVI